MRSTGRRVPTVLQATISDCGPACLAMVLAEYGRAVELDELREEMGVGRDGLTALELRDEALRRGLACRAVRADAAALPRIGLPAIAHWEGDHFVVVERVSARAVTFVDPAIGRRRLPAAQFAAGFTGIALTFSGTTGGRRRRAATPASRVWRTHLVPALAASRSLLAALGAASALLMVAGLIVPVATARVVSAAAEAVPGGTSGLWLPALGLGVAVLALAGLRGLAAARLQDRVGRQLPDGLLRRLLAAPLAFFEQRGTGEVVARLMATDVVRDALATRVVAAVLDATVAVAYLTVLAVADRTLFGTTVLVAAVELTVVGALTATVRRLRREELIAASRCSSWLVESVGGIGWVKAAGAENLVLAQWRRLHGRRLDALGRAARVGAGSEAVIDSVRITGPLVLLLVAVGSANRPLPLFGTGAGSAVGLAVLAAAALLPLGALAGHLRALADLASTADHLGDLAGAPAEQAGRPPATGPLRGGVRLRNLGFRHTARGQWVLRDVDVTVPAGGKLAVVGASGSGKSTLVKLVAGLYAPTEGAVLVDGVDVRSRDLPSLRRRLGVVLQEPFLLSGTVAENIALRRPSAPLAQVWEAARLAAVHDDVVGLPRGYDTVLAEGGGGLSGGQRQRLALARALLDRPAVLVLDEATSHLDTATEAVVERNLRDLGITRIVIAHRLSTVRDADHVVVLDGGRVVEEGPPDELLARGGHYATLARAQEPEVASSTTCRIGGAQWSWAGESSG